MSPGASGNHSPIVARNFQQTGQQFVWGQIREHADLSLSAGLREEGDQFHIAFRLLTDGGIRHFGIQRFEDVADLFVT